MCSNAVGSFSSCGVLSVQLQSRNGPEHVGLEQVMPYALVFQVLKLPQPTAEPLDGHNRSLMYHVMSHRRLHSTAGSQYKKITVVVSRDKIFTVHSSKWEYSSGRGTEIALTKLLLVNIQMHQCSGGGGGGADLSFLDGKFQLLSMDLV
jgi:hypothetical protein